MTYLPNESGYYPPGAEFDPRAPWNWDDEPVDDPVDEWEDFTGHQDDLDERFDDDD